MKKELPEFKVIATFQTGWNSSRAKTHKRKTITVIAQNEDRARAAAIELIDLNWRGGCINIHSITEKSAS